MASSAPTDFFGFEPIKMLGDVHDAAVKFVYDGVDEMEQEMCGRLDKEGMPGATAALQSGFSDLASRLAWYFGANFDILELYAMKNIFTVRQKVLDRLLSQSAKLAAEGAGGGAGAGSGACAAAAVTAVTEMPTAPPATEEEEVALDASIGELMTRVLQARAKQRGMLATKAKFQRQMERLEPAIASIKATKDAIESVQPLAEAHRGLTAQLKENTARIHATLGALS